GLPRQPGHRRAGQRPRRGGRRRVRAAAPAADRLRALLRHVHPRRCAARGRGHHGGEARMSFPYLSVLTVTPAAGAAVVALLPRGRPELVKRVALGWSLAVFALTVVMWAAF